MNMAGEMPKFLSDRYFWFSVALYSTGTIATYLFPSHKISELPFGLSEYDLELLAMVFQDGLFLLAIMAIAWRYNYKWALAMVLVIGLTLLPHIIIEMTHISGVGHLSLYVIGTFTGIGFSYLVGYRRQAEEKIIQLNAMLQELSVHDGLTGAYNFRYFSETLEMEFKRACRHNLPLTYIILDIDDFKFINDRFGHAAGDLALVETARLLKSLVRETDIVARYGGDEFAIILPNTGLPNALAVGNKILTAFRKYQLKRESMSLGKVSLSIGISALPDERIDTCKKLIEYADKAMYRAKESGKDNVCTSREVNEADL